MRSPLAHGRAELGRAWRDDSGQRLLRENPLRGLPYPKEENPKCPVLSEDAYLAIRAVAGEVDWRAHAGLVLALETGHRINAILRLRWSDVALDCAKIRWRAENEKLGMEHETPITAEAADALRHAQRHAPGIGDTWIFPSTRETGEPSDYGQARYWWRRMEELAGIEHVKGMGWHGARRRFATDLKDVPLPDLAKLGGWKATETILKHYQVADEETMKGALERGRRKYAHAGDA